MTEEEAKSKWCPFTRVDSIHIAPNRVPYGNQFADGSYCVGPKCMAWRWLTVGSDGYCGLAGKPT